MSETTETKDTVETKAEETEPKPPPEDETEVDDEDGPDACDQCGKADDSDDDVPPGWFLFTTVIYGEVKTDYEREDVLVCSLECAEKWLADFKKEADGG